MEYRNLGRTGVKVTPLCLGTMNFGSRTKEDESTAILNRAIEFGINFIDTANRYGDAGEGWGRSEEIIGKALEENAYYNTCPMRTLDRYGAPGMRTGAGFC